MLLWLVENGYDVTTSDWILMASKRKIFMNTENYAYDKNLSPTKWKYVPSTSTLYIENIKIHNVHF